MTSILIVTLPDSLKKFRPYIIPFIAGMIAKLEKNNHKDTPTVETLPRIMDLLRQEIVEFEEQIAEDKFNNNSLVELMDQANFSFLAYVALRMQGVEHDDGIRRTGCPPEHD